MSSHAESSHRPTKKSVRHPPKKGVSRKPPSGVTGPEGRDIAAPSVASNNATANDDLGDESEIRDHGADVSQQFGGVITNIKESPGLGVECAEVEAEGLPSVFELLDAPITLTVRFAADADKSAAMIRVTEQTAKGTGAPVDAEVVPGAEVQITPNLTSDGVGYRDHTLVWELVQTDGAVQSLTSTAIRVFRVFGMPELNPVPYEAVWRAMSYASGAKSRASAAVLLRGGIRGKDHIAYDPRAKPPNSVLDLYHLRKGNCVHFSDAFALLAKAIGLSAKHVVIHGGFKSSGQFVEVLIGQALTKHMRDPKSAESFAQNGALASLVDIKASRPEYGPDRLQRPVMKMLNETAQAHRPDPGVTPDDRWAFSSHCIVEIEGRRQDAALDVEGFAGRAALAGREIEFVEPKTTNDPYPGTNAYDVPRKSHTIGVEMNIVDMEGAQLTLSAFDSQAEVYVPLDNKNPKYSAPVTLYAKNRTLTNDAVTETAGTRLEIPADGCGKFECEFGVNYAASKGHIFKGPKFWVTLGRKDICESLPNGGIVPDRRKEDIL